MAWESLANHPPPCVDCHTCTSTANVVHDGASHRSLPRLVARGQHAGAVVLRAEAVMHFANLGRNHARLNHRERLHHAARCLLHLNVGIVHVDHDARREVAAVGVAVCLWHGVAKRDERAARGHAHCVAAVVQALEQLGVDGAA
eukprot:365569-Chlamydomonas_euryale.AAC.14